MNKTLKQLLPNITDQERKDLGEKIANHGIKRVGKKVKEGDYWVNIYHENDHPKICGLYMGQIVEQTTKKRKRARLKYLKASR